MNDFGVYFVERLVSIPGLPGSIPKQECKQQRKQSDDETLQVGRNLSLSRIETAEDNHGLPASLSLNLFDG